MRRKNPPPKRSCDVCGTEYQPQIARSMYCGPKCKELGRTLKRREAIAAELSAKPCAFCGEPLERRQSRKATTHPECSNRFQGRRGAERRKAARRAATGPCQQCGEAMPSTRKAGSKFCSDDCWRANYGPRRKQRAADYMRLYRQCVT